MLHSLRVAVCLVLVNAVFAAAAVPAHVSRHDKHHSFISATDAPVLHACVRRKRKREDEQPRHHFVQHPRSALVSAAPLSLFGLAFQTMEADGQRPYATSSAPPDRPPA